MARRAWGAVVVLMLSGIAAEGVVAQERPRTAVTVDYVGVEGVYLPAGADDGLAEGDTLVAFAAESGGEVLGRFEVLSVSRRRSVVSPLPGGVPLQRGTTVFLDLHVADAAGAGEPVEARQVPARSPPAVPRADAPGPRVSGRFALDLDGRESRTSWDGDLFGETRRRFATSVARLGFRTSGLPGDITLRGNLRAALRYSEGSTLMPEWSVRAYELSASKRFEGARLDVQAGRFLNPYERFSAYWDGLLMRVGGRSFGVGVIGGLEPARADEAFSTDLPKATAFADVRLRGTGWRYASDLSWHWLWDDASYRRTFLGWSQSVRAGRVSMNGDVRVDRPLDTSARSLGRVRIRGGVDVSDGLTVRASFARRRRGLPGDTVVMGPDIREERALGLSMRHAGGVASLDGGWMRWADDEPGRYASAMMSQRLGALQVRAGGRFWVRNDARSLSLAPGALGRLGPVDLTLAYRLYRTTRAEVASSTHSVDLTGTFSVLDDLRVTLGAQRQWGVNLRGTRVRLGLWRAF